VELVFTGKLNELMSLQCSGEFLAGHHTISLELFRYEDNVQYSQHPRNATPQNATLVNPSLITTKFLNQNAEYKIDPQTATARKLQPANQICVSTDWLHLGDVDCRVVRDVMGLVA
jgi:hypothetical protein